MRRTASDACPGKAGGYTNGEAERVPVSDEAVHPCQSTGDTSQALLERVLARDNMQRAWKRVKANRGTAGVDGLDIAQTGAVLKTEWPTVREQLRTGQYRPRPVRRISIPKANGGERQLGIPTVTGRLIQQALLQVMQPLIDPCFSEHSHGFRPGRSHVQAGYRITVDIDLESFFDHVNRITCQVSSHTLGVEYLRGFLNEHTSQTGTGRSTSPVIC